MNKEYIIVAVDYGSGSIWVDCDFIELTEEEIDLLSTALWEYKYEINFDLWLRSWRKPHKQWQFIIKDTNLLDSLGRRLIEIIKELFPNKLVEFYEENKYD